MGVFRPYAKIEYIEVNNNPDPTKYKIIEVKETKQCTTVLKIKYDNCTNHEGIKILVFAVPLVEIINQKSIDPHFGKTDYTSKTPIYYPIARFEPTDCGWLDACNYTPSSVHP